jgi:hypothetical protein
VDSAWQVLFLVIQCGLWLAGKKILVSPGWVDRVSESSGNLYLDITRQSAEDSPGYDPDQPVDRDLVERLADYYKDRPQTPEDET